MELDVTEAVFLQHETLRKTSNDFRRLTIEKAQFDSHVWKENSFAKDSNMRHLIEFSTPTRAILRVSEIFLKFHY